MAHDGLLGQAQGLVHHEVLLRNSRVYAAKAEGTMNGLFALVPCKRGDVLVEYTGRLLTQKEAAASDSEYLLDADKVAHAAQPMVSPSPPDGYKASLAGTPITRARCKLMRWCWMCCIPSSGWGASLKLTRWCCSWRLATSRPGRRFEFRFDYDGAAEGFREAMISRGIDADELDSSRYREARWRVSAWAMMRSQRSICDDCRIRKLSDVPGLEVERQLAGKGGGFEVVERG